ncbi:MAG: HEPN domain-containing protein [Candidatus Nezhaarchaeota archaeon]|nr:HEPN domain-containing protein [Candidatus Nezhaarchaeota archaeon]MCX8141284.1 HEPN domain-containing protein [Candidatus Nezhaarchaeota archaeon]MDW8049550.1 HEPN domain-containing protein [Nitrososphaerota archaeon]
MINIEMARDYIFRSKRFLKEADMALEDGDNATSIRRSQEALEMAVKALLRAIGIEYPRSHDVSDVLVEHSDSLPEGVKLEVSELAMLVSQLASIRGVALYGYEREGIPASRAFTRDYAERILQSVKRYVSLIERSLKEAKVL